MHPHQISEDRDYEIARILLGDELFKKLDFMTLEDVTKKQIKVSIEDIENIALSENTTTLNQATSEIRKAVKQKGNDELLLDN